MMGYGITDEQSVQLNRLLEDISVEASVDGVFMSDYGGNILAYVSQTEDDSIHTMAALAAGSFAATRELAGMIGEPTFHSIFHQGTKSSVYIQNIAQNFLILVIFGKSTTTGLVKLFVDKASKELEPILKNIEQQSIKQASQNQTFEMKSGGENPFQKKGG